MTHIDEGTLQAYLDDEVGARAEIETHLRTCEVCATELAGLRRAASLFSSVVRAVDAQAPARAALNPVASRLAAARGRRRFYQTPLARAALFVVGFAAIASAAIPGSPVRAWISGALRAAGVLSQEQRAAPTPVETAPPAAAPAVEAAALSIAPVDGRVTIILTNVGRAVQVRVRMTDDARALVQATGAAAKARFNTGAGRIELIDVASGTVMIDLPNGVRSARVESDGRVIFEKGR